MQNLPLNNKHEAAQAKFCNFAGYRMSLYYQKPIQEHHLVRTEAGVFDVSHMGQIMVDGAQAEQYLNFIISNGADGLSINQARYGLLCDADGGVIDDLIVYRTAANGYRLIINASNRASKVEWLLKHGQQFDVSIVDSSAELCLLAVQGPEAFKRLRSVLEIDIAQMPYYTAQITTGFGKVPLFVGRTGYTGEQGCELSMPVDAVEKVWDMLTQELNIAPIGLVARDTLRLEAAMALYGNELKREWNPYESGVGFAVALDRDDFIGREALQRIKASEREYRCVGLEMTERGIPRSGYTIWREGVEVGLITSGALSPTLNKPIALARLKTGIKDNLTVLIRDKHYATRIVKRPFYKQDNIREVAGS